MKHILIPTDLTIASLHPVHAVIAMHKDEQLKITLLHLLDIPTDISSLLFMHKRHHYDDKVSNSFKEACQVLENRFRSQIISLRIKFAFGSTTAYVKNLLTGEQIDSIIVCSEMKLGFPFDRSIDMMLMLKRSGFPLHVVPLTEAHKMISAISMHADNDNRIKTNKPNYVTEK